MRKSDDAPCSGRGMEHSLSLTAGPVGDCIMDGSLLQVTEKEVVIGFQEQSRKAVNPTQRGCETSKFVPSTHGEESEKTSGCRSRIRILSARLRRPRSAVRRCFRRKHNFVLLVDNN